MLKNFFTSLTYQITDFASKHEGFFKLGAEDRAHKMKALHIPSTFKLYLAKVSPKDFMADLTLIVKYIENPKQTSIKGNHFFMAAVEYLTGRFPQYLDTLDSKFYLADLKTRQKQVDELIPTDNAIASAVKKLLIGISYQQLCEGINALAKNVAGSAHIIVQAPREIELTLRKDIRKKLTEENPLSFPIFQINKKLIGGMRVFKNGEVLDHSWHSRVRKFLSLTAA
ncbi:hypothetical protein JKY72_02280 [Candidatus Gracilibacteria bacterium]|nr:hypothetical protein [Candidatus Gracilibacteria bacterium]